ncbi:conserved hypothetical protein [Candidatus Sulfopaludibacter sp. SbA4]|nr:conserved hypothetical protein [Candidatus Sulfopaludibacter sp. SbA4]
MIPYSFSVLRYIHDGVTAEFVNVGVAVYAGDPPYLKAKCTIQYGRITRLFDRIDGDRFKQLVRYIEEEVTNLGEKLRQRTLPFAERGATIHALLKEVLPPDDSAIQFSPAGLGVTADLDATLAELYERYVERYSGEQEVPSRSNDEVWRVFRRPLERRNVMAHLTPKKIVAPDYEYEFRAAWKNEDWHVFEPVSFDLVEPNSMLEKANRWVGRSASLVESPEQFRIHLLIGAPQDPRLSGAFTKTQHILGKMSGNPEIVLENQAEEFAAELERQIGVHGGDAHDLFDLR